ncbi:MAG TPA: glycosyltransferase family 39 protein [Bacteroidia bacterium]|nr:glycosyltransferase family 39 protein [Bacteroidia bacterium]
MANVRTKAASKASSRPVKTSFFLDDRRLGILLALVAFLLYVHTSFFDYALDDRAVTYENTFVKEGKIKEIFTTFYWDGYWDSNSGLFRPLSLLLLTIEWQIAENSPGFYHFTNVLLYAVCAYLLYRLLRDLLRNESITLAFFTALVWIVLPVHTEVAANIKGADEILSVLFFILSFRSLLKWSENGKILTLALSACFIFLALLSKEGAALFIPVMLLALILFRQKKIRTLLLPVLFFGIVSVIWLAWHWTVIHNTPGKMVEYTYHNNALLSNPSKIDQLGTAIGTQARYWVKMLTGYPLSYNYSFNEIPVKGFADPWPVAGLAGMIGAIYYACISFRKRPVPAFGISFYFITFALTSNIFYIIGDTMADRFTFAPSIGFCILLVWLVLKFTNGLGEKRWHTPAAYVLIPLAMLYSMRSYTRTKVWANEKTLFTNDAQTTPESARVHLNYGVILVQDALRQKDESVKNQLLAEAYKQHSTAFDIDSLEWQAAAALGEIEYQRANYRESANWFIIAKSINPYNHAYTSNLAGAYLNLQKFDSAIFFYEKAIAGKYVLTDTYALLGNAYLGKGDTLKAIAIFEKGTMEMPASIKTWDKLANLTGMKGMYKRSNEAFLQLTKLTPADPRPYQMLSTNYGLMGDTLKAREYYNMYSNRINR